jgi:RNA polymerase sigma-70 factor (ECF subfamily)
VEKVELEDVLSALVRLYSPRVFGLLYRLSGSREVAEDLLQETFLRVVRTIGQYEHVGRFEAWLFRIAANLARDRARQGGRRGRTGSLDGPRSDDPPPELVDRAGPERRLVAQEESARLAAGLDQLSAAEREILLLRHYSGLPFAEIARILGVPLGTALARAHRALQHLRAAMSRQA